MRLLPFLTTIEAGNAAAARTYIWPTDFGAAGSVLQDAAGNGVLSWRGGGAGPVRLLRYRWQPPTDLPGRWQLLQRLQLLRYQPLSPEFSRGNGTAVSAASVTGSGAVVLTTSPSIASPTITGHAVIEGVTATGATGTGKFVFDGTPTLITPVLGVATGTSLQLGAVSTTTGDLFLANAASASLLTVKSGNNAAPWTITLPPDPGTNTFVLSTDGSGNTSWATPATGTGGGTVTSVSVVSANGFAGTVANSTSTPAITLHTSVIGILSGNGSGVSAASTTGTGAVVLATSPTLVTPNLGVATATSINGATFPPTVTLTGDVTGTGTTSIGATIAANAVSDTKLRQSAGLSVIGRSSSAAGNVADIIGTAGQVLQVNAAGTSLGFGLLQPAGGGTGQSDLLIHSVLVGAGTSSVTEVGPGAAGTFFTGRGATLDPAFTSTPTLGVNGTTFGTLSIANGTGGGAFATIQNRGATVAYNFNLPATAGTAGQVLTSQGGGTYADDVVCGGRQYYQQWLTNIVGGYPVWSTTSNTTLMARGCSMPWLRCFQQRNQRNNHEDSYSECSQYRQEGLSACRNLFDRCTAYQCRPMAAYRRRNDKHNHQANFTTGDAISVGDGNSWVNIYYLTVTRTSLGTTGPDQFCWKHIRQRSRCYIIKVRTFNHNIGLTLGGASFGFADQVYSIANRSHGVKIIGTASQAMQWQLSNILSEANGGDGFNVAGAGSTPCGQWRRLSTDSNSWIWI